MGDTAIAEFSRKTHRMTLEGLDNGVPNVVRREQGGAPMRENVGRLPPKDCYQAGCATRRPAGRARRIDNTPPNHTIKEKR